MSYKVGDVVLFGRANGEKTKGEIVKINQKSIKIRQTEDRGTKKSHNVGTIWKVHPSLIYPVNGSAPVIKRNIGNFAKGDKVSFKGSTGITIVGVIKRVNKMTCTIETNGPRWRVSPALLTKV